MTMTNSSSADAHASIVGPDNLCDGVGDRTKANHSSELLFGSWNTLQAFHTQTGVQNSVIVELCSGIRGGIHKQTNAFKYQETMTNLKPLGLSETS